MDSETGPSKEAEDDRKDRGEQEDSKTEAAPPSPANTSTDAAPTRGSDITEPSRPYDQHETPNIRDLQPEHRRPGDFDRDLMPGGDVGDADPGGNLMGPNHPTFGGPPIGGGYGMRPRFDPFGPPGGPTDPRNLDPNRNNVDPNDPRNPQLPRRPRPPPGGTGEPNPDHERPPNDLNNNLFM